jgi:hypothetical protein
MTLLLLSLPFAEAGSAERAVERIARHHDKGRLDRAAAGLEELDDLVEAQALRAWLDEHPEQEDRAFFLVGLAGLYAEVGDQHAATAVVDEMLGCCLASVPAAWRQLAQSRHAAARNSGLSMDYGLALDNYVAYLEEQPEDEAMQAALAACEREALASVDWSPGR